MNIQIFGRPKCFETKKAERFFKERGVRFQAVDLDRYGMSRKELLSVISAVGLASLVDEKAKDAALIQYLAHEQDKIDKLFENPKLIRGPVVRNGKQATAGYAPEVWQVWIGEACR